MPNQYTRRITEADIEYIRHHYNKNDALRSTQMIADKLGVKFNSVRYHARKIGLTTRHYKWENHHDEFILENYTKLALSSMAKRLGRTVAAVSDRMYHLGLSRKSREGWYRVQDLSYMFGVSDHWVKIRIYNGTLKASTQGNGYRVEEKDLIKYIRSYTSDLTGKNIDIVGLVDLLVGLNGNGNH